MRNIILIITATLVLISSPAITRAKAGGGEKSEGKSCMAQCLRENSVSYDESKALKQFCKEECGLGNSQGSCLEIEDGCCVPDTEDPDCDTGCWTNENCDEDFCLPDINTQPNYTYNEGLSTILRGILIDEDAASALDILAGYYRVREFRVWSDTSQRAIVLNIDKNYGELATGGGILPKQEEEWVFSIIELYEYNSSGWKFIGYDFHGHQLSFEIPFDYITCLNVILPQVDCIDVEISTETMSGAISSCGWDSEPPWTIPTP